MPELVRKQCGGKEDEEGEVFCFKGIDGLTPEERPTWEATLFLKCFAEAVGTGMIVLFGVGSVVTAVTSGALMGLWQVATVWGFTVAIAISCTASVSGAHLNPAITIAAALFDGFPKREVIPYILSQLLGAIVCGAVNLLVHGGALAKFEKAKNITRGQPASVLTACAFGEYFPNPGIHGYDEASREVIGVFGALCVEAWGTFWLAFVIRAVTDQRNSAVAKTAAPGIIGFTVAVLISVYAPLTQAGWNPARDFGPRLVAAVAGWGTIAIPGPQYGFWVYIVGPIVGATLAFGLYNLMFSKSRFYQKLPVKSSTALSSSPQTVGNCSP